MPRGRSGGAYNKVTPPSNLTYGDSAEIAERDKGTGAPSNESHFTQIGPNDQGGDASNPSFTHLSGDIKFSRGVPR